MGERLPLGFLINTLAGEFRDRTGAALEQFGLSTREVGLMTRLSHHGTLSQSRLGQLHHTDRTSMVGHVDRLEARGFVERRRDPSDRRVYLICLTDLGESTLRDARKFTDEVEQDITGSMTDRQREQVRDLLMRALDDIQDRTAKQH